MSDNNFLVGPGRSCTECGESYGEHLSTCKRKSHTVEIPLCKHQRVADLCPECWEEERAAMQADIAILRDAVATYCGSINRLNVEVLRLSAESGKQDNEIRGLVERIVRLNDRWQAAVGMSLEYAEERAKALEG